MFTSGSTGKPKGVVLSHTNILENIKGIIKKLNLTKGNYLSVTPLYHNNGQFIPTLAPLVLGRQTFTIKPIISVNILLDLLDKYKINFSSVMVTHINYSALLNARKKIQHVKFLCCGGAKLDIKIQKQFEKKFKIKILANYGLTETSSISATESLNNYEYGSVGKALFNNKIKIFKKNKKDKYGEILIKGKNIFKGYFKKQYLTKKKFISGYFKTGDLGYLDCNKNLFVFDRLDNMMNISG